VSHNIEKMAASLRKDELVHLVAYVVGEERLRAALQRRREHLQWHPDDDDSECRRILAAFEEIAPTPIFEDTEGRNAAAVENFTNELTKRDLFG
jgi:hypothetical protein